MPGPAITCYGIVWGYRSAFLTVGGGSSCSGGVWVDTDEAPEDPTAPAKRILCDATQGIC